MKTAIVSDLHLGADNCQRKLLEGFLISRPFDRLILNGDTLDGLKLNRLSRKDWWVIERLSGLAVAGDLTVVLGNHDHQTKKPASRCVLPGLLHIAGCSDWTEVPMGATGPKYLVMHGDHFDPLLGTPLITEAADWIYRIAQQISKKAARWLKRKTKHTGGALDRLVAAGRTHAQLGGYAGLVLGHTHHAADETLGGLHYLNSGCWTEAPASYVLFDDTSRPRFCWYE